MIKPYDIHTHTVFCDGSDSPEIMAKAAIDLGMGCLGFSGHEFTSFDTSYCMSVEGTAEYRSRIAALKDSLAGKINILCGTERDYFGTPSGEYDYVIGSVHYLHSGDEFMPVDLSRETFAETVEGIYGGDYIRAAEEYYSYVARLPRATGCGIIGHFDLITKYGGNNPALGENNAVYRDSALSAADRLISEDMFFEINTGAVTRGLKAEPYPARFIMKYLAEKKAKIILSGDTHSAADLCRGWKTAAEYAGSCGFVSAWYPDDKGFSEFALSLI